MAISPLRMNYYATFKFFSILYNNPALGLSSPNKWLKQDFFSLYILNAFGFGQRRKSDIRFFYNITICLTDYTNFITCINIMQKSCIIIFIIYIILSPNSKTQFAPGYYVRRFKKKKKIFYVKELAWGIWNAERPSSLSDITYDGFQLRDGKIHTILTRYKINRIRRIAYMKWFRQLEKK